MDFVNWDLLMWILYLMLCLFWCYCVMVIVSLCCFCHWLCFSLIFLWNNDLICNNLNVLAMFLYLVLCVVCLMIVSPKLVFCHFALISLLYQFVILLDEWLWHALYQLYQLFTFCYRWCFVLSGKQIGFVCGTVYFCGNWSPKYQSFYPETA